MKFSIFNFQFSILGIIILAGLFLIPVFVQAGLVPCGGPGEPDCTLCHFFVMFNNIVQFIMFRFVPLVAVLMLVIGGIMFFIAGARPDVLVQARGIITSVVIGLIVTFCAWVIVNTIITRIGIFETENDWRWYKVTCRVIE